jgi:hypothetical protein
VRRVPVLPLARFTPHAAQLIGVTSLDVVRANTFVSEAKGVDMKVRGVRRSSLP